MPVYFLYNKRIGDLVYPINLVLLLLFHDSLITKIMLVLINYQFMVNILPALQVLRTRTAEFMVLTRVCVFFKFFI